MRVIPAIDIIEGKLVRLTKGRFDEKSVYSNSPLDVAKSFEDAGLKFLHLVDLDGARAGKVVNLPILESICSKTNLQVDFGGGVKNKTELKRVFNAGAAQVTGGSIAVKDPEEFSEWLEEFGSEKIILGCDVKNGKVAISGWLEESDLSVEALIEQFSKVKYVICTDVSQDGTLEGANLELYSSLTKKYPQLSLIASGGVGSFEDLEALPATGVEGVVLGKAIYEGKVSVEQLVQLASKSFGSVGVSNAN